MKTPQPPVTPDPPGREVPHYPTPHLPADEWLRLGAESDALAVEPAPSTMVNSALAVFLDKQPEIPGYTVIRELGRGGMSIVYLAEDNRLKRQVAIKVILDRQFARRDDLVRFQTEAETLARLRHPNITQIYEVGTAGGVPFIVLEYAGGGSLDRFLRGRPQVPRLAAQAAMVLAEAMQSAHESGIVHRDLKPGNVLVSADRGKSVPIPVTVPASDSDLARFDLFRSLKVSDFGLAKRLDQASELTKTGMVIGTPNYMAPEQAAGDVSRCGPLTDVYALGAILYEMLTGRMPFAGPTAVETILLVQMADPLPPRTLQPGVPRDLETICLKAMNKLPEQRYASAGDLAADLRRFLERRPILARPTSAMDKLGRWCRRNPVVAGLGAALFLTLLAGLIAVGALYLHADARRLEAEEAQRQSQLARQRTERERQRAVAAEKQAEQRAARLEAFKQFLGEDYFRLAHPNELGPQATMKAALLQAAERISDRFASEPDLEAFIRDQIGARFFDMSLFREAEFQQRRALELYNSTVGPNHIDTLNLRSNLVTTWTAMGRYAEAEKACRAVLADRERLLGPDDPTAIATMGELATILQKQGKLAESEQFFQQAYDAMARVKGPDDGDSLVLQSNLAGAQVEVSKFIEAERNYRAALTGYSRFKGPDDLTVLGLTFNLGNFLLNVGKPAEALPLLQRAAQAFRARLGDDAAATLIVMSGYAGCLQTLERLDEAEPLLRLVVDRREKLLGPKHPQTLLSRHNLAGLLDERGQLAEAARLYQAVLADTIEVQGVDHPDVLATEYALARNVLRQRRWYDAEQAFTALVAKQERILGASHHYTQEARMLLAEALLRQDKAMAAEEVTRVVLAIRLKAFPAGHFRQEIARSLLGLCLLSQGRAAEAEPLLIEAATALMADADAPLVQRHDAAQRVIAVSEKLSKPEQADAWRKRLQSLPELPPSRLP